MISASCAPRPIWILLRALSGWPSLLLQNVSLTNLHFYHTACVKQSASLAPLNLEALRIWESSDLQLGSLSQYLAQGSLMQVAIHERRCGAYLHRLLGRVPSPQPYDASLLHANLLIEINRGHVDEKIGERHTYKPRRALEVVVSVPNRPGT